MNFKQRIWLLPIMVAVISTIGIAINTKISSDAAKSLADVENIQYPLVEEISALKRSHETIQELLQQAVAEGDASSIGKVDERAAEVTATLAKLSALDRSTQSTADDLSKKFDAYVSSAKSASAILLGKTTGDSSAAISAMQNDNAALDKLLTETSNQSVSDFKQLLVDSKNSVQRTLRVSILSTLVVMLALGIGSYILINNVFNTLGGDPEETVAVVRRIATGDFRQQVNVRNGDTNSLLGNVANLQSKLGQLILNIHQSSASVDSAAHEMNSAVTVISDRTSSQAASLEETASSMEQMTATVRQNADSARQANQLAADARKQAESGGEIVNKAIGAMAEINQSSKRIADIIGVIDEIAFQTNLLALNAAVEAARAGEQGRGFAVVASEVRNLAQRSATAAREIKTLISDSVNKVQDGSELVDASGKRLMEIVTSVKKVADIIGDISSASQDQARGLDQVNSTVASLDAVTQQNTAMVNQASGVSDNVALQAKRLLEIVSVFKINDHAPHGGGHSQTPTIPYAEPQSASWQRVA